MSGDRRVLWDVLLVLAVALAVGAAFPAVSAAHRGPGYGHGGYDRGGNLTFFESSPTLSGPIRLSALHVRRTAVRFLTHYVHWFNASRFHLLSSEPISHEAGNALTALHYRTLIRGIPGPALCDLEVDRRTGRIVSEDAVRTRPTTTIFRVSRQQAIRLARRAAHVRGQIRSATRDIFRTPRWTVVIFLPGVLFDGQIIDVTINGSTGRVIGVAAT